MKNGILTNGRIPLLLGDKNYSQYYHQGLILLNMLEIVLPLDKDYNRILFPLMLPEDSPVIINERLSKERYCFKRYVIFYPGHQSSCPPGLWSRLLARVMNKVKEVKNIIDEQTPIMSQCSGTQEGCLDHNNAALIANTTTYQQIEDQQSSTNVYDGGESLVVWQTGLFYSVNELFFTIKSLAGSIKYEEKNGVFIMCSRTTEGKKLLCELVDIVNKLISEWYPELAEKTVHKVPCHVCVETGDPNPCEFKVRMLMVKVHKLTTVCKASHQVKLVDLVPDLLLADLDPIFHLDSNLVIFRRELLGHGAFADICHGRYNDQPVAVKVYRPRLESTDIAELRSEIKVL